MPKEQEKCFVIMPITTPKDKHTVFHDGEQHFRNVLEYLFSPAIEMAGFQVIPPSSSGSIIIQADIIEKLSKCEMVLCDISIYNPNVFFELGIRTALDLPVAIVKDEHTRQIPFDTSIIQCEEYPSNPSWYKDEEIKKLSDHIKAAKSKSSGRNALWNYFGITQKGNYDPGEIEIGEKMDFIIHELSNIKQDVANIQTSDNLESISLNDIRDLQDEIAYIRGQKRDIQKLLDEYTEDDRENAQYNLLMERYSELSKMEHIITKLLSDRKDKRSSVTAFLAGL